MVLSLFAAAVFSANTTLVNLPADSWYQVPNSKMDAVCMPGLGGFSCWAIAGAWGGATYNPDDRIMMVWGGGHGDSYDNSMYTFSLDNLNWRRLTDNTGASNSLDPQANGDPISRHTYDGLSYITHAKRFFGYNGAIAGNGGGTTIVWTFDVATKHWYNMNPTGTKPGQNFGGNGGSAYDPVTKNVYYASVDGISAYNFDSNAWTQKWSFTPQDYAKKRGMVDNSGRILFVVGSKLYAYNLTTNTDVTSSWTTTGGSSVFSSGQCAADYDSKANQIVGWSGSGGVYALNMTTKVWTQKSGTGAPTSSCGNGTYGRFHYIPEDNVFVLCNANESYMDGYQDVWFYKNTAGGGTSADKTALRLSNPAFLSAHPNPFGRAAALSFSLDHATTVSLRLFDLSGRMVKELLKGNQSSGSHEVLLDGAECAPGIYLCKLIAEGRESTTRLSLIK